MRRRRRRAKYPLTRTADGLESDFGINHLGHFALTGLLLRHVTGRVVTVASQAERLGRLDFDDLNWERRPYKLSRAHPVGATFAAASACRAGRSRAGCPGNRAVNGQGIYTIG